MSSTDKLFDNIVFLIIFFVLVVVVGLLAGIIYYDMALVENVLKTVDFAIPLENNATAVSLNMTHFQDILKIVVYPILDLKDTLPVLTYFMVFAFIIALGMSAYLSSRNPVFFVVHILFTLLMTYFCFIISNAYMDLMTNPFINSMMTQFVIYNKLMFFLPQIVFFTSMIFGAISFINIMKPQQPLDSGVYYGGDY